MDIDRLRKCSEIWSKLNIEYGLSAVSMLERGEDLTIRYILKRLPQLLDRSAGEAAWIIANGIGKGEHRS